jgi:hypothetical protein
VKIGSSKAPVLTIISKQVAAPDSTIVEPKVYIALLPQSSPSSLPVKPPEKSADGVEISQSETVMLLICALLPAGQTPATTEVFDEGKLLPDLKVPQTFNSGEWVPALNSPGVFMRVYTWENPLPGAHSLLARTTVTENGMAHSSALTMVTVRKATEVSPLNNGFVQHRNNFRIGADRQGIRAELSTGTAECMLFSPDGRMLGRKAISGTAQSLTLPVGSSRYTILKVRSGNATTVRSGAIVK